MTSILYNVSYGLYRDNRLLRELTACCKLFLVVFMFLKIVLVTENRVQFNFPL